MFSRGFTHPNRLCVTFLSSLKNPRQMQTEFLTVGQRLYREKLTDPRWQAKRLFIMSRDGFKCTLCGCNDTQLEIHHIEYLNEPWDILNTSLVTLCHYCHKLQQHMMGRPIKTCRHVNSVGITQVFCFCTDGISVFYKSNTGALILENKIPKEVLNTILQLTPLNTPTNG